MATPKNLIPTKYEVIKTRSGAEIVGMTRDTGANLEITLPMICHLSMIPGTGRTQCIFYPYAPLSSEEKILMPKDHIVHRSSVNEQFIPHYDNASSTWFDMITEKSIPLGKNIEMNKNLDERIKDAMRKLAHDFNLEYLDDEQYYEETGIDLEEDVDNFLDAVPPKDKKKLH